MSRGGGLDIINSRNSRNSRNSGSVDATRRVGADTRAVAPTDRANIHADIAAGDEVAHAAKGLAPERGLERAHHRFDHGHRHARH